MDRGGLMLRIPSDPERAPIERAYIVHDLHILGWEEANPETGTKELHWKEGPIDRTDPKFRDGAETTFRDGSTFLQKIQTDALGVARASGTSGTVYELNIPEVPPVTETIVDRVTGISRVVTYVDPRRLPNGRYAIKKYKNIMEEPARRELQGLDRVYVLDCCVKLRAAIVCPAGVFLLMDFVEGITYGHWRPTADASKLAAVHSQLRSCIEAIHGRGIIHRDIKPDNIMIRTVDSIPILVDFGSSCFVNEWTMPAGTEQYRMPEYNADHAKTQPVELDLKALEHVINGTQFPRRVLRRGGRYSKRRVNKKQFRRRSTRGRSR